MGQNGLTDAELLDLFSTTLSNSDAPKFEVALEYQKYVISDFMLRKNNLEIKSGDDIRRHIVLDDGGQASHTRLFAKDDVLITDLDNVVVCPWRRAQTHWAVERRELLQNRTPSKLVDLQNMRKVGALVSMANILEQRGWQAPDSAEDDLTPYGIPTWLVGLDEGQAGMGFYGAGLTDRTSSHTIIIGSPGSIDPATAGDGTTAPTGGKANWRNACAGGAAYYTGMDATALITMANLFYMVEFKSPDMVAELANQQKMPFRIYMDRSTIVDFENMAKTQNDQLGGDLWAFGGRTSFKRVPVVHVPYLEKDLLSDGTTLAHPIFMINHSKLKTVVLEGDNLRESEAAKDPERHNTIIVHVDLSYNFLSINRRTAGAVLRKTA